MFGFNSELIFEQIEEADERQKYRYSVPVDERDGKWLYNVDLHLMEDKK